MAGRHCGKAGLHGQLFAGKPLGVGLQTGADGLQRFGLQALGQRLFLRLFPCGHSRTPMEQLIQLLLVHTLGTDGLPPPVKGIQRLPEPLVFKGLESTTPSRMAASTVAVSLAAVIMITSVLTPAARS